MLTPPLAESGGVEAALELGPLVLAAALYLRRARTLARDGHAVPRWRLSCFLAGLALIGATLTGLGGLADELLYAHMIEHLLVGDVGALLLVLGLTGPLLAPVLRVRALDRLRVLAHPAAAFPLWAIDLYVWHLPTFYEAALRHTGVHALEHAMFIGFGANMWMCLFGPLPTPSWFGNLGRLIYIFAVRLTGAVLGNVFAWSGSVFYPIDIHGDGVHHISPIADQNLAGAVMMVEGSVLTLGLFCWLFLRAARESEERQELLDYASARGLELSETRAARAVAAGSGSHLRTRLGGANGAGEEQRPRVSERGTGA
jgi:cytochrome c oxidase assembly factor CtaG